MIVYTADKLQRAVLSTFLYVQKKFCSAKNLLRMYWESAESLLRVCWESAESLLRVCWESAELADMVEKEFSCDFCYPVLCKSKSYGISSIQIEKLGKWKGLFVCQHLQKRSLNNKSSFQNVIITTTANLCVVELLASSAVAVCNFA